MDGFLSWVHKYKDIFDVLGSLATAGAVIISLVLTFGNKPKIKYLIVAVHKWNPRGGAISYEHLRVSAINNGKRATRCFNFYLRTGRLWWKKRFRIELKENPFLNDDYEPMSMLLEQDSVITAYLDFTDFLTSNEISDSQLKASWIGLSTSSGRYETRLPAVAYKFWADAEEKDEP